MANPITRAADLLGGQSAVAKLLSLRPPTINQWVKEKRPIPPEYCVAIESATGGKVTAEELLPRVRWVRTLDLSWPHPDGRPLLDVAAKVLSVREVPSHG